MNYQDFAQKSHTTGIVFLCICCFSMTFSSSVMGASAVLFSLCWLFSGNFKELPAVISSNRAGLFALLLLILLCVGLSYTPAPIDDALSCFKKYRELLFFLIVLCLLQTRPKAARYAEISFTLGAILLLTISYAIFFKLLPFEKYGYSTVYHITHSFFMALLAFWCFHNLFRGDFAKRVLWFVTLCLTVVNLFYIAPGRTGMLVFAALMGLGLLQRLKLIYSFIGIVCCMALLISTYYNSTNFKTRVNQAVHEIETYQPGQSRTSLGMRFDWWQNSIELIKQKPLLGHGTGSFAYRQGELIKGTETKNSDNPHNEYLLIGVQTGLIGTAFFILMLASLFIRSFTLPQREKYLLQGCVIAMGCGCLMNSFLLDSHQGHFFGIMTAVLSSCTSEEQEPQA